MLAMVSDGTVGPVGVAAAAATVRHEAVPRFLGRAGAVEGLWMVDRITGRLLTVTIWADRRSMEAERSCQPPTDVSTVARVLGLRPADVDGVPARPWARVTSVDGMDPATRTDVEAAHPDIIIDQSRSEGFCGSCWLSDEHSDRGLAVSLWDGPHALIRGEHDSKRRRRELARRFGARVTNVSELECLGVAVSSVPR